MACYIIKGNIIHTPTKNEFEVHENCYCYIKDGKCVWIKSDLSAEEKMSIQKKDDSESVSFYDYSHHIIIPSFIDLHVHAPQYIQMGIGLDLPLIDWLNQYTFRIEERFADVNYGRKCYPAFVEDLYNSGTLRSVIFGTIHKESNEVLVDELYKKGLCALVGKVNMNRFAPVNLSETVEQSVRDTYSFVEDLKVKDYPLIKPIMTPRFAPSCTSELLGALGRITNELSLPIQSHLCETEREIDWVKDLFKDELFEGKDTYSDVYINNNLFGNQPTVMAHGIYLEDREKELVKEKNVFIAHCPTSNMNLTSGIMPLSKFLDEGIKVGLGSDIGAGHTLSMNQVIISAVQNSKLRHVLYGDRIIVESEAFYLATKGNGEYFEQVFKECKIGSFETGSSFDALVIKDDHPLMDSLTPLEQLQRFLYCGTYQSIKARFLQGELI